MPDPAPAPAPADEPANPTPPSDEPAGIPEGLPPNDPNGEGTTPAEVSKVLRSSGINLPVDDEEGDDPDAGDEPPAPKADDEEPAGDEPAGDEDEPAGDEEEPAADPPKPPASDAAAEDDKYSFTVTDANGVTFKIAAGATMEEILAEFEPKNNGQILDILNQVRKLEDQKAADESKAADDQAAEDRRTRASELLKGWGEEATALQTAGRIPEGDDGQTRINAVYKFMADENDARMKAGKPTLNSFEDALDKLENKEARDAKIAADKADKDKARENGGKVGGSSAPASSGEPVYRAGSAKNANQALRSMGLLKD